MAAAALAETGRIRSRLTSVLLFASFKQVYTVNIFVKLATSLGSFSCEPNKRAPLQPSVTAQACAETAGGKTLIQPSNRLSVPLLCSRPVELLDDDLVEQFETPILRLVRKGLRITKAQIGVSTYKGPFERGRLRVALPTERTGSFMELQDPGREWALGRGN